VKKDGDWPHAFDEARGGLVDDEREEVDTDDKERDAASCQDPGVQLESGFQEIGLALYDDVGVELPIRESLKDSAERGRIRRASLCISSSAHSCIPSFLCGLTLNLLLDFQKLVRSALSTSLGRGR